MSIFRVGVGVRDITPPLGTLMAGYFEPHHAEEVVDDLRARALVVQGARGERVAVVSCDVLALEADTVKAIRTRVARKAGVDPGQLLVCATHNHTGPQTAEIFGQPPDGAYLEQLVAGAAEAVAEAVRWLEPSELRFGLAQEERINCNRRVIMRDGTVHTHTTEADEGDEVGREGPSDPEVGVLSVSGPADTPRALLVNYALHPTNVRGDRICPDYPGYLEEALVPKLTGQAVTVFVNGACGNLDSKTPYMKDVAFGPDRARRIAEALAESVLAAVAAGRSVEGAHVGATSVTVRLPLKRVRPDQVEAARAVLAAGEPGELVFTRGTRRPSVLKERIYAEEALRIASLGERQPWLEGEVQGLCIGDVAVVGVPVELFTEFGLEIKQMARERFSHVMVVELANGYLGYVPTRKSFDGGGYETRLARSSPLEPEAGEMLVEAAGRVLQRLHDRPR